MSIASNLRNWRDVLLLALAAVLLAMTFARPTSRLQLADVEAVVVIDITQSMNATDQLQQGKAVSRLAYAKAELERVVGAMPCGSKIGWGIFTEHRSFLMLTPLEVCEHQRELLDGLRRIDGGMAWAGDSEIAKGLNSGLRMAKALESLPALVFVTDGHEAPPINPRYRPAFTLERGAVRGLLVGVGGDLPVPIPKLDPSGRRLGEWSAKEVMQIDPRSAGRGGSVSGEQMTELQDGPAGPAVGATPGAEHLSSLREGYLQLLASETGLTYLRLSGARELQQALADPKLTRPVEARRDLRPFVAGLALAALLWPVFAGLGAWLQGRRAMRPHK
jgi:mxaL protein